MHRVGTRASPQPEVTPRFQLPPCPEGLSHTLDLNTVGNAATLNLARKLEPLQQAGQMEMGVGLRWGLP